MNRVRRGGALAILLGLAALAVVATTAIALAWPPTRTALPRAGAALPADALRQALLPEAVEELRARLAACGRRTLGGPGLDRAADLIAGLAREAGAQVVELPVRTPHPVTRVARLTPLAGGEALGVLPFKPNLLQPGVTPPGGLSGRLVAVDAGWEGSGSSGAGAIALVDAAHPPPELGLHWSRYAARGFSALVVAHRDGLAAIDWTGACAEAESSTPIAFPRVAAGAEAFALAGGEVRLEVDIAWQETTHRAIAARVTPPAGPAAQALVISVPYDQVGAIPDLVPGPGQDLAPAAALAAFRALAARRAELGRDVILVAAAGGANADDGLSWLISAAGAQLGGETGRAWWSQRAATLAAEAATAGAVQAVVAAPGFLVDPAATAAGVHGLGAGGRELLARLQRQAINDRVAELNETALAARVAMQRGTPAPGAAPPKQLLDAYIAAKQAVSRLSAIASWSSADLAGRAKPQVGEHDLAGRLVRRLAARTARLAADLAQAEAAVRIGALFASYETAVVVEPRPLPGPAAEQVAVQRGNDLAPGATGQAFSELCQRLVAEGGEAMPRLKPMAGGKYPGQVEAAIARVPLHASAWSRMGYPAAALVHVDRAAAWQRSIAPARGPAGSPPAQHLRLTADLLALLAAGRGEVPLPQRPQQRVWGGQVLAGGIGAGLVPDHPLAGALVTAQQPERPGEQRLVGHALSLVQMSDDLGRYGVPPGPFAMEGRGGYTPVVAGFGPDGLIRWVKDQGARAQALFRSDTFGWNPPQRINLPAFRADPLVVTDRIDPRLLRPWAEIRPITRDGLSAPPSWAAWDGVGGLSLFFLEPDRFVIFTLNAGSPENPLVRSVRSVLLGAPVPSGTRLAEAQPDGLGYLAADRPWIIATAHDAAASLLRLDARKVRQQVELGLARPGLAATAESAAASLDAARAAGDAREALKAARRAGALAQQNHETLKSTVAQAVANIVWYLFLLVPFALFTEKLVVGASDVRKQILWAGCIFLAAFAILALLHPAFPLLASPAMILLGFVIMLIALGVAGIFLGRFQENLRSLQARRGQVEGARVDVLGVTATAFLLGLNGLSRRKVRTGLTSATLVLITFALICFAGTQRRDGVAVTAVGPAAYQGLLVEDEHTGQIGADEAAAMRARYAPAHLVCERSVLVGSEDVRTKERGNPQLDLVRGEEADRRTARAAGALFWQHDEPLAERLRLLAGRPWREAAPADPAAPVPVLVSEAVADELRLDAAALAAGPAAAVLNGQAVAVAGIFAADSLAGLRDLDGRSVLPYDIEAMLTIRRSRAGQVIAYPDDPLLPAARVILLPRTGFKATVPSSERRLVSCAVAFRAATYREASALIADHQQLSGLPLAYGLDGTAFVGRPVAGGGFGGVDLLIPLLIAALTVLNTMRGSVYERRDEIAVFNAVGIAPRFIAAMFFAEALVYAVVGAVAGFLLALLLGRGLAALGLDAGLKLDVASLAPVWASLALAAAVFLSTWFPARQAAEIAAPSDDSGWKMPAPEGDRMAIELPFAFDARDRLGVLAFFARWFRDHGEGGAGPFQAGEPALSAERVDGQAVARIAARVWLKPFDQGVAQELRIELHPDRSGEWLARLTIARQSGSHDAWLRLNRPFMGALRRHFLYWRAVDAATRAELFEEAGAQLRAAAGEAVHV